VGREVVLSADLGSGSLRVGAVTANGTVVAATTTAMVATARADEHGARGVDPERWWRALSRGVGRTLDRLAARDRVRGLCLSGITRTQIVVDRGGRPIGPAIPFRDTRAAEEAAEIARHLPADNPADAVTAFHPLARLTWLARRQPRTFERAAAVLEPKDFLNWHLTGVIAADRVTYSRYDALRPKAKALSRTFPDWLERSLDLLALPRIAPWELHGTIVNHRPPWNRLAGIPVFAGAMDAWATAVGAGAIRAGHGYDIAGTSEVAGLITAKRARVPGLVSLFWSGDTWQVGGPTQAGADCAEWCHRTFRIRRTLAAAVERAGSLLPTDTRPVFLPYLAGERAPLWRADLRGAFEGVAREHGGDDFLWAVLEGVAMAMRDILTRAVRATATPARAIRVAGGGAQSNAWCQIKADVMDTPVIRTSQRETGLVGAAMAAAVGLGWHRDLAAAADAMTRVDRVFEPRATHAAFYAQRARRYERARQHALDEADGIGAPVAQRSFRARRARTAR
jgi:xylulokinase